MEYLQYLWYIVFTPVRYSFKPCYKWNTFNTEIERLEKIEFDLVLNLVINGIPSIHYMFKLAHLLWLKVLNLVINGIPSILNGGISYEKRI